MSQSNMSGPVKFLAGILAIAAAIVVVTTYLFEDNPAGMTMVIQSPISGELTVHTTPGWKWQGGGTITSYKQVATISFGDSNSNESGQAGPVSVRFNDNGTASVYGNARFTLPSNEEQMIQIHKRHRSYDQLVETLLVKHTASTLVTSAAMFSAENIYGGGKAEYERITQDQLENGKYQTNVSEEEIVDPVTNDKRRIKRVSIKLDADGKPVRLKNPLAEFGIRVDQFLMDKDFQYEKDVLKQMSTQREAFQSTVTARAQAQRAQQDVITARAEGEAAVVKAEYEKLVEQKKEVVDADKRKLVAITEAEGRKQVAQLDREAAEQTKLAQIALGEGEAFRRKAVMEADGGLNQKLATYERVANVVSDAIKTYQGNWVPQVVMGGNQGRETPNAAQNLMDMLMVKTAKDLAVDMNMNKQVVK